MITSETKLCPFCGEEIKAIAVRCKHCHATLDGSATTSGGTPTTGGGRGTGAGSTPGGAPVAAAVPGGTLAVGQVIGGGRFELKKLLGTGGMGEVYQAEHQYTGQKVAIKAVWPNLMAEQNARARFLQEGRTLGGLKHPNIVGLQDFFEEAGRFFLVMEYVEGETLDARLRRVGDGKSRLDVAEVERVLLGILGALAHAHRQSPAVVHRDVKPSNVMLGVDGRVVLMDFGIAKVVGGEKLTRTRGVVGTYEYMSPEQVQGGDVSPATDVYAVGIMAFEMLTGCVPFPQTTDSGIDAMKGHLELPVPDLGALRPDCPKRLLDVVVRALAKRPADRHAHGGEMRAEFVGSEGGELNTGGSSPTEAERSVSAPLGVRIPTLQSLSMVRIPSGSFLMGSPPDERGRSADEMQHKVVLDKPFLLGRIPVTQAQWRAVMGTDKSSFRTGGADCPVETVSWLEAIEFCNRLSEKDGLRPCYEVKNSLFLGLRVEWNVGADGHRLPSEAEWEYACRAGTTGATYADVDDIAWHNGNSGGHPQPCARRQPNAWGLYDMLGNVMEWVWDSYEYRSILGVAIPEGTDRGARKVVRGGSFEVDARGCRAACRTWVVRDWPSRSLGFRLARSLPEA